MADVEYRDVFNWHPGDCPEEDGPVKYAGWAVVRALHGLHDQAQKLAGEKSLSAQGAAEKLAPLQKKVIEEADRQRRVASATAADLKAAEDRLFSPPVLEPGDSVTATNDMRRCEWYDGLDVATRDAFEAEARAGKHPEIIKALARSPTPGRARAFGLAAYRAEVETKKGERVSALRARRRSLAWLEGVLNVAPRVAQSDPWSDKPVEGPIERMNRARASMKPHTAA